MKTTLAAPFVRRATLTSLALAIAAICGVPAQAQDASSAAAASAPAAAAAGECRDNRSATEMLDASLRDWRQSNAGQAFQDRDAAGELLLLIGQPELVGVSATNPQFGKSRELAFTKAFLRVQSEFVRLRGTTLQTEVASEFLNAPPSSADLTLESGDNQNRYVRLGEKMFDLAEAKLDEALREAGVPENDIKTADRSKKIETFKDSVSRKAIERSFAQVAGILPIQNFEAIDCNNVAAVATVAVFAESTLDLARSVVNKQPMSADTARAGGPPIARIVDDEIASGEILDIFGLRKTHDQDGYPALVSYGQWSYLAGGLTPREREMKRKAAMQQAESSARAQLAMFLQGSAGFASETMTEETTRDVLKVMEEGTSTESLTEIIEKQTQNMQAKAQVTLSGLRNLASWSLPHPDAPDVTLVGVTVGWTPQFVDAVNKATGSRVRQAASSGMDATDDRRDAQSNVRTSKVKNNAADF